MSVGGDSAHAIANSSLSFAIAFMCESNDKGLTYSKAHRSRNIFHNMLFFMII